MHEQFQFELMIISGSRFLTAVELLINPELLCGFGEDAEKN